MQSEAQSAPDRFNRRWTVRWARMPLAQKIQHELACGPLSPHALYWRCAQVSRILTTSNGAQKTNSSLHPHRRTHKLA